MRKSFFPVAAILLLSVTALPPRAHAVAKEIIELQTQVSQLQDMISQMKQSNDERMGVLLHMVQQNADSIYAHDDPGGRDAAGPVLAE